MSNVSARDGLHPGQFHLIAFGEKGDRSGIERGGPSYPDRVWTDRGEKVTFAPNAELVSGQATYEPRKVDKFIESPPRGEDPRVYEHSNGERVIVDGHHRFIADRLQGKPTEAHLIKYDPARDGDWR